MIYCKKNNLTLYSCIDTLQFLLDALCTYGVLHTSDLDPRLGLFLVLELRKASSLSLSDPSRDKQLMRQEASRLGNSIFTAVGLDQV